MAVARRGLPAECGRDILKEQLVLFGLGEDVFILRRVELRGVFGGDERHRLLGRIAERRHDRPAIVAFPRQKCGIVLGIKRRRLASAIEAMREAGHGAMHGFAGGTSHPRTVKQQRQFSAAQLVFAAHVGGEQRQKFRGPFVVEDLPRALVRDDFSMASNLPLPFLPLTLTPCGLGPLPPCGRHAAEPESVVAPATQPCARERDLALGVSASPGIDGSFSSLAVSSLRSQREASASASSPRNGSWTVVMISSSNACGGILGAHLDEQQQQSEIGVGAAFRTASSTMSSAAKVSAAFNLRAQADAQFLRRKQNGQIQIVEAHERFDAGDGSEAA